MWRLQFIREYLSPPSYERVDYHLPELIDISRLLDRLGAALIVVASPRMQAADHIMVVQYLTRSGMERASGAQATNDADEVAGSVTLRLYLADGGEEDRKVVEAAPDGTRIVLLRTAKEGDWVTGFERRGRLEDLLMTENFALQELHRTP